MGTTAPLICQYVFARPANPDGFRSALWSKDTCAPWAELSVGHPHPTISLSGHKRGWVTFGNKRKKASSSPQKLKIIVRIRSSCAGKDPGDVRVVLRHNLMHHEATIIIARHGLIPKRPKLALNEDILVGDLYRGGIPLVPQERSTPIWGTIPSVCVCKRSYTWYPKK